MKLWHHSQKQAKAVNVRHVPDILEDSELEEQHTLNELRFY